MVHVWVQLSNIRGRAVGTPVIKHPPTSGNGRGGDAKIRYFLSTRHLNGHYADVRDFLCYVHRGHTPQNTFLECVRSVRRFRTQDLFNR